MRLYQYAGATAAAFNADTNAYVAARPKLPQPGKRNILVRCSMEACVAGATYSMCFVRWWHCQPDCDTAMAACTAA